MKPPIQPTSEPMPERPRRLSTTPDDAAERERLAHLRPPDWRNPTPAACYDLVVVGGGTTGLVAAQAAAALGKKVALVERRLLGGNCLNIGCVPSKALIRTSRLYAEMRDAERYGAQVPTGIHVDFAAVMQRMRDIRARVSRTCSARDLAAAGVDVFFGLGRFVSPTALQVGDSTLNFRKALIATGARPDTPQIPGLVAAGYYTNASMFNLTTLPPRLLVIGGGPLGCEMAQAFCRLGAQTTIVQHWPLFLPREERDAAQLLSEAFGRDGLAVRLNTQVVGVRVEGEHKLVDLLTDDYHSTITVDAILTGTGRRPSVEGLGLEAAGVTYDLIGGVGVDDSLRTSNRRIFAAGDVCLDEKFNDTADASARIAVHNALCRGRKRLSALTVAWCTYTDPEIAHVGLYVRQARERNIPVKTFTILMHDVDRAVVDSEEAGFVKIHVREGTDQILGATIVARHAGEMISEITLAMTAKIGLGALSHVMHPYPTQAEAITKAAEAYLRTCQPAIIT
ncbi:MAG: mercuric reductase [Rhodanobacter sp.]